MMNLSPRAARTQTHPIPQKHLSLPLHALEPFLEIMPQAAMLVHLPTHRIGLSNTKALQLSAHSRQEQQELLLEQLFANIDGAPFLLPEDAHFEGSVPASLLTRSGEALAGQIEILPLPAAEWVILTFETQANLAQQKAQETRQKELWPDWQALAEAQRSPDLVQNLDSSVPALLRLTGSSVLAIYTLSPNKLSANRAFGAGPLETLPETIELHPGFLELTTIWQKGKPPRAPIHQRARAAGLSYLASVPLGEVGAWIGLLVAGGTMPPQPDLPAILQALAADLTTLIQFRSQQAGLQQTIAQQESSLQMYEISKHESLDGVMMLSPELKIQDMNRAAEKALGYTLKEIRGEPVEKILIGYRSLDNWLQAIRQSLVDAAAPAPFQQRIYHRDGHAFLANLRARAAHYQGQPAGVLIFLQDLSELDEYRKRNEQIEHQAYLGEVRASLAHQIKNPMNSLSTGIQLLEELMPAEDPLFSTVNRLQADCERLITIVDSGLSFIRPVEYKMQPIRLEKYLQRLLELDWRARLNRNKIRVEFNAAPGLPQILGDERAIQHLFNNLVDNACDAMQGMPADKALLGIRLSNYTGPKGQPYVAVRISDTGPGIPDAIKERLFEPFFTTKEQGTGLGLAIVRRIVTAHAGSIELTSLPGGTVFLVCLPIVSPIDISLEEQN